MSRSDQRWVLAFDASCGTCQEISDAVAGACEGRVEVLPLSDENVGRWRQSALGPDAPWTPTLLEIERGAATRAWTGSGMSLPLLRRLGPRATVRVLRALGALRRGDEPGGIRIGRARFLQLGTGVAVAAAVVWKGQAPALASSTRLEDAREWVRANPASVPQTYEELIALPMAKRRAVYEASTPEVRGRFWVDQIERFRRGYAGQLTGAQHDVLGSVVDFASRPHAFDFERTDRRSQYPLLGRLREQAEQAFGSAQAYALFATLGPSPAPGAVAPKACEVCGCATADDWCGGTCQAINCAQSCENPVDNCACFALCGFMAYYECDGVCK